ncbi:MAG: IPT/TIG domain-containing protein, partial [Deltaproteobacteria bacterium]|nr:IPT/TIG domain-containing protein [Deltaproteobacteria bacterium]
GGVSLEFDSTVPMQLSPYVHRIDPANGKAGDTVTILGFGFSAEAGSNIISFGGEEAVAASYAEVSPAVEGELESLTATVPDGVSVGDAPVYVTVFSNTSNANVSFTINE